GTTWAAVQIGVQNIPPLFSAAMRFCIACIVLGGWILYKKIPVPKDRASWILIFMIAATSYTVTFALQYWGQKQISSGLASILFATFPFWIVILSKIFLQEERIHCFQWIALVVGFSGVMLIFHDGFSQQNTNLLLGMAAVLVSALIQSSALIILRKYRTHIDPVIMNFWAMLIGAVTLLVASAVMESISIGMFDRISVIILLYLGTFGTVVTFVIYFWLAQHMRAIMLSLISFITPVIALFIGVLWMHEIVGFEEGIGVIAVLGSLIIANIEDFRMLINKKIVRS
ncbi:MAG TPA: EamA family transporter, partial [Bacteroidota bacterium]|nr:EamA family transporter [Bacteroidota bacterium]